MELLEELVEEILLRFPPSEPASLVRAALVCKPWYRIVSNPRFRRRFRQFHRSPPILGFIYNLRGRRDYASRLVPASPACPLHADRVGWRALDARHGRVLLCCVSAGCHLAVWDPISCGWCELPPVFEDRHPAFLTLNAAVLCASTACDHTDCHGGPFAVVCLSSGDEDMSVCVYSSEAASWNEPPSFAPPSQHGIDVVPPALVGNALYFLIGMSSSSIRYDLATRGASVIHLPPECCQCAVALTEMENGGLGVLVVGDAIISLWSVDVSPNGGDKGWTQTLVVIDFEKLLPADARSMSYYFVGFARAAGLIFVAVDDGLLSLDLKSGRVSKICEETDIYGVIPYTSFYTPALGVAFANDAPGVSASSI